MDRRALTQVFHSADLLCLREALVETDGIGVVVHVLVLA